MKNGVYDPNLYKDVLRKFLPVFFPHVMETTLPSGEKLTFATPPFHHEILSMIQDEEAKKVILLAPRGHAKSSLITFVWVLYCVCYQLHSFIIIVSDSHKKACQFLDRIKREIEGNKFLSEVFDLSCGTPWSSGEIVVNSGEAGKRIRILARGTGQSLRGFVDDTRPSLIILDDIETDENCATPERREKIRDWFFGQVLPALDPYIGRLIFVGTMIHEDALLARLYFDPPKNWISKRYQAILEDGKHVLWPERFTLEMLLQTKDEFVRQGMMHKFYTEYQNDPASSEYKSFKKEFLRYYDPFRLPSNLRHYMATDFGASMESGADYSVILVGAVDDTGNIYIREYVRERMVPSEVISTMLSLYDKYQCIEAGIETNGPQKIYYYMIDEACRNKNNPMRLHKLDQRMDKEQRIMALQPKIENGQFFILPTMSDLVDELMSFPRGRHDDVIDAASNLMIVLTKNHATAPRRKDMMPMSSLDSGGVTYFLP